MDHIKNLKLSTRAYHCIIRAGITTIQEVKRLIKNDDIYRLKNAGKKTIKEIKDAIAKWDEVMGELPPTTYEDIVNALKPLLERERQLKAELAEIQADKMALVNTIIRN